MLRWEKIIRGGGLVMLMVGVLEACTPMSGVRNRSTDRPSTPLEAPAWPERGSEVS